MSDEKEEMEFKIDWCNGCGGTMVRCPKCDNNCCNGGYGRMDENGKTVAWNEEGVPCDVCPLAYQYQHLYWKMEKFCTCQKECTCKYEDAGPEGLKGLGFKQAIKNDDCPIHNILPPDSNCPVHGEKEQ